MGLIGGIARTAVAAGTWTAVQGRVARRQSQRWAKQDEQQYYQQQQYAQQQQYVQRPQYAQQQYAQQQYAQPAAAQVAAPTEKPRDRVSQLKDLAALKDEGILTEEEFAAEKARILG